MVCVYVRLLLRMSVLVSSLVNIVGCSRWYVLVERFVSLGCFIVVFLLEIDVVEEYLVVMFVVCIGLL